MVHWPVPSNLKQLRGFLGLTGYYRRFIAGFASIAAPLTDLLRRDAFLWGPKAELAFAQLKEAMTHAPVLRLPDFTRDFVIETDASHYGIGAVLMQDNHPISFFSKKIGPKLQASSTYIKELHAITEAVRKWRQYLLGRFFVIRTDHKSIKELLQQVIQTPEQQVYVRKLLGYQFHIEYKQGISNRVADALSRFSNNLTNTTSTLEPVTFDGAALLLACIFTPLFDLVSQVHSANTTDPYLLHLHEQFQQGKLHPTTPPRPPPPPPPPPPLFGCQRHSIF